MFACKVHRPHWQGLDRNLHIQPRFQTLAVAHVNVLTATSFCTQAPALEGVPSAPFMTSCGATGPRCPQEGERVQSRRAQVASM